MRIAPMLATAGPVPVGDGWAFEIKFDGVRAVGYLGGPGWRAFSRTDRDVTSTYPEIAERVGALAGAGELVVDGEVVAWDDGGRPDFGRLQHRMHVARPSPALRADVPVQYVVFDLLRHGGTDLLDRPYTERRARLEELAVAGAGWVLAPSFADTPGAAVLDAARRQGLEGVVAKRRTSPYRPGRRSRDWVKTPIRHTAEVVVAGWLPGGGARTGSLGSLVLAAHDADGSLVHVGEVGTGFTDAARARLLAALRPLARDNPALAGSWAPATGHPGPARHRGPVHWVEPELVGEIEYRAFTADGRFRHPSWRGLRADKDPADVTVP